MHELAVVEALVANVFEKAQESNAKKINRVYLVVGELSGVLTDAVEFYFAFLTKDSIAAGASLFFVKPPTQVKCRNCGTVYNPENLNLTCPNCKEKKVEIISGRELYIESMEVEE
jgi:hydrogenase nickel incorporation protein HypA/HybF